MTPGAASPAPERPRVVVVGAGITGLAAAWELTGGSGGPTEHAPEVVVLDAARRLGGKLQTQAFDPGTGTEILVDTGPDSFLGRRPEALALCREVGLGDHLVPVAASGAALWARDRSRPLPAGLVMGIPTRVLPLLRAGILSPLGRLRLVVDRAFPRPDSRGPLGDRAIGPLIGNKLGWEVVDVLVDPLIGGIHAGSVADMSAAAAFPLLLAVAQQRGSFMRALAKSQAGPRPPGRRRGLRFARTRTVGGPGHAHQETSGLASRTKVPSPALGAALEAAPAPTPATATAPVPRPEEQGDGAPSALFWSLRGGLASLVDRLVARLVERGVDVRTGARTEMLERDPRGPRWILHSAQGPVVADAVILAVPAPVAATLVGPHDADAATLLRGIEHASVATVTLSYRRGDVPDDLYGTGLLVPRTTMLAGPKGAGDPDRPAPGRRHQERHQALVTACTYLSAKWPQLALEDHTLIRASVGRFGDTRFAAMTDQELVSEVASELTTLLGTRADPRAALVTRWMDALPQYRVHHLLRVAGIESAFQRLPGVYPAGASYRGLGIPACVESGRKAARQALEGLAWDPGAGPQEAGSSGSPGAGSSGASSPDQP